MSSEIMLATTCDPAKVSYPAEVSIKLDGVAADFYKTPMGWMVQSRQGEPLPSCKYILDLLNKQLKGTPVNTHIIGELTVMGVPEFKIAGGIIRRHTPDSRIVLNVYDAYVVGYENETYEARSKAIAAFCDSCKHITQSDGSLRWNVIKRVPVVEIVNTQEELEQHIASLPDLMKRSSLFEGFMVRSLTGPDSKYRVNKRSRGMARYKPVPTLDLRVVAFEEATANKTMTFLGDVYQAGDGLGAVGRIVVEYKGKHIGVGPGCLTHVERRELWTRYTTFTKSGGKLIDKNLIAEVSYMLDDNYDALRQATFKQWRTDKAQPSEVA